MRRLILGILSTLCRVVGLSRLADRLDPVLAKAQRASQLETPVKPSEHPF